MTEHDYYVTNAAHMLEKSRTAMRTALEYQLLFRDFMFGITEFTEADKEIMACSRCIENILRGLADGCKDLYNTCVTKPEEGCTFKDAFGFEVSAEEAIRETANYYPNFEQYKKREAINEQSSSKDLPNS